jgi:hypothetical protein
VGDGSAIAERPVTAATCAGTGGADEGAPHDDGEIVSEDEPGVEGETGESRAAGGGRGFYE